MGNSAPKCEGLEGEAFLNCALTPLTSDPKSALTAVIPEAYEDAYYQYQIDCNSGKGDPEIGTRCFDRLQYLDYYDSGQYYAFSTVPPILGTDVYYKTSPSNITSLSAQDWNFATFANYEATRQRIIGLCGEANYNDVWPHFYHPYNTDAGKPQVDAFLKNHANVPQACKSFLTQDYDDAKFAPYQLMNAPDLTNYQIMNVTFGGGWAPDEANIYDARVPWDDLSSFFPSNLTIPDSPFTDIPWGFPLDNKSQRDENYNSIIGKDSDGNSFMDDWMQAYNQKGMLNWSAGKNAWAYADPDGGPGQLNWSNDPDFAGNLPLKANYLPGEEPWHRETRDANSYGYTDNPCFDKPFLDRVIPPIAGVVGGGLAAMFVPGSGSKVLAGATIGSAVYLQLDQFFGLQAVSNWISGNIPESHLAGLILSIGLPATFWQMLFDLNLEPAKFDTNTFYFGGMIVVAGVGYLLLYPLLSKSLSVTGGLFAMLMRPFFAIENLLTYLFNGCYAHTHYSKVTCMCEQANTKPLMAQAMVKDIYGCTGNQESLRMLSMHAAMVNGTWGPDPVNMGTCTQSNGHMSTPIACISAGEFAYGDWDASLNPTAQNMWNEIYHCVDQNNRSLLPPAATDAPCVKKYGLYARKGDGIKTPYYDYVEGNDNSCYDYRAPLGMQKMGEYDWGKLNQINDGCTIL